MVEAMCDLEPNYRTGECTWKGLMSRAITAHTPQMARYTESLLFQAVRQPGRPLLALLAWYLGMCKDIFCWQTVKWMTVLWKGLERHNLIGNVYTLRQIWFQLVSAHIVWLLFNVILQTKMGKRANKNKKTWIAINSVIKNGLASAALC